MADLPIGSTPNIDLKKWAEDANPGATELNNNWQKIDDAVGDLETTKQDNISVTAPLIKSGNNLSINIDSTNFKVPSSKLDTIQPIHTASNFQVGKIGIGGPAHATFYTHNYGDSLIDGFLWVDGDIYVGGNVNQINEQNLYIQDRTIRLNDGGDNASAINGGIILQGASGSVYQSIIWDGSAFNISDTLNLASGKSFKLNGTTVIDSNRNISGSNGVFTGNINAANEILSGELTYNGNTKSNNPFLHITTGGNAQIGKFGGLQISTNYNAGTVPNNGILFYQDTNLYRDNANVLKTDGNFILGGSYLKSYGDIYSDNFSINYPYKGYYLGKSGSVFEKINATEMHVKSFVNDEVLTFNSELDVAKSSTKLTTTCNIVSNTGSLKVEHLTFSGKVFSDNDYVLLQSITRDSSSFDSSIAIGKVVYNTSSSVEQTYNYYKVYGSLTSANSGSIALNLGKDGDGFIRIRAISELSNKAYMNFSTFNTSSISLEAHTQLGDLTGVNSPAYGALNNAGFWSNNIYLEKNASVAGTLTAGDSNGIGNTFYAGRIKKNLITTDSGCPTLGNLFQVTSSIALADTPFNTTENVRQVNYSGSTGYIRASLPHSIGIPVRDKWYTVSCWIRKTDSVQQFFGFEPELGSADSYARPDERTGAYSNGSKIELSNEWQRVVCSFRWTSITPTSTFNLFLYFSYAIGTAQITAVQIEESENVSVYQKSNGVISSDSGYGMWAINGGFGGTIQNPVISLSDSGMYVNTDYILGKKDVGSNGIYIGNYQSKSGFNGIILNQDGQTFYNNNSSIFNFDTVNASASIASWNFNNKYLTNGNVYIGKDLYSVGFATNRMLLGSWNDSAPCMLAMGSPSTGGYLESGISANTFFFRLKQSGNTIMEVLPTSAQLAGWSITSESINNTVTGSNGYAIGLYTTTNGANRPRFITTWGDGTNTSGWGGNFITIGASSYINSANGQFTTTGWDTNDGTGGISVNVAGNNVLFAGVRKQGLTFVSGAAIAGWNFDNTKFWTGTPTGSGYFTTSGITLGSSGYISMKNFLVDTAGNVSTRNANISAGTISGSTITGGTVQTSTSGQRIILNGADNTQYFYTNSSSLSPIKLTPDIYGTYPFLKLSATDVAGFRVTNTPAENTNAWVQSSNTVAIVGASAISGSTEVGAFLNAYTNGNAYLAIKGQQVIKERQTGWTAGTGTANKGTFNYDTATTAQLAQRCKALEDVLRYHGLIN
jgi:hypothetical protein